MEHFNGSTLASSGRAYVDMDRAMRLTGQTDCCSRSIPHGNSYVIGLKTAFQSSGMLVSGMMQLDTCMVESFKGRPDDL